MSSHVMDDHRCGSIHFPDLFDLTLDDLRPGGFDYLLPPPPSNKKAFKPVFLIVGQHRTLMIILS